MSATFRALTGVGRVKYECLRLRGGRGRRRSGGREGERACGLWVKREPPAAGPSGGKGAGADRVTDPTPGEAASGSGASRAQGTNTKTQQTRWAQSDLDVDARQTNAEDSLGTHHAANTRRDPSRSSCRGSVRIRRLGDLESPSTLAYL